MKRGKSKLGLFPIGLICESPPHEWEVSYPFTGWVHTFTTGHPKGDSSATFYYIVSSKFK
ncbi:MAG: hypothetical protein PWQ74_589 [Methanobacteriaceae archaeon]|nr:MAG: hypothetical protein XD44_0550 [Methanobacteriaceae archaeon 41_258]MDI3484002.1 hypothetical protein [Methanobacteriaceae archaeon]